MLKNEIKKENHCEKTKIPLASNLFFFYFKGIFIISLCVLNIYNFFIFDQIPNYFSSLIRITKKLL
jgi:hypothetical protein